MSPEKRRQHDLWIAERFRNQQRQTEADETMRSQETWKQSPASPPSQDKPPSPPRTPPTSPPSAESGQESRNSYPEEKSRNLGVILLVSAGVVVLFIVQSTQNSPPAPLREVQSLEPTPKPIAKNEPEVASLPVTIEPAREITPEPTPPSSPEPPAYQRDVQTIQRDQQTIHEVVPPTRKPPIKYIYWDTKQYAVKAERAAAIQKKIDLAWSHVREYMSLKDQKTKLEDRLKRPILGKERLKQTIDEIDAKMRKVNASGTRLIKTIETEINAASP